MRKYWIKIVFLALVAIDVGCGGAPEANYPTEVAEVDASEIGTSDKIEVRVFYGGGQELVRSYTIGSAGTIAVPFLGKVMAAGQTQDQLEDAIQSGLANGYLVDPVVSVDITDARSKKVAVIGQVKSPGTLAFYSGMTIVDAISQAGGFTPTARPNNVTVTRRVGDKKQKYTVPVEKIAENKAVNFPVHPGDVVFIPERSW